MAIDAVEKSCVPQKIADVTSSQTAPNATPWSTSRPMRWSLTVYEFSLAWGSQVARAELTQALTKTWSRAADGT